MADLKITALPALVEAGVQAVDVLALADLSATETKKVTVKDLVAAGVALIDDGDIPAAKVGTLGTNQVATGAIVDGAVTNVKLANSSISLGGVSISLGGNDGTPAFLLTDATGYLTTNLVGTITNAQLAGSIAGTKLLDTTITYAKLNLSDGDIPGAKIATGGITATQLAANSVTASELADDAVDTAALADGAVVAASIAADTITSNQIAANAIGASELADNSVDAGAIAADAVTTIKILDANVTAEKLAANLPGSILATGAIGSTQLAADSVTASELADNAVDSGAIAASAVTDAKIASGIGGAKITDGTITATKLATANIDRSLNVANNNLGINNTVVAATRSGITYNAQGLITGTVALAASDLPLATTSAVGGVSVGTGLAVTGAGALSLSNSVTAATISGITYNAQGQITATTALVAGDLPAATTSAKGAVLITSGGGISVDGSGAISTSTSGITAGTYTKVTVNNKGVATAGASLVAGDIPNLAATKITSGTFDVGRFGTNTILGSKFADSSVCQFTGAQSTSGVVTFPTAEFKGQFFYDLTNDDLYVYDGSAFQPVTITSGEIIYAGNYRADTNKITSLTAAGTAQGYTVGAALQAAAAANNRYYFVCDKSGTGTSPAPTVTINPPDMILSNGSTYEKLDISNFIAGQVASNIGVTATGGIQNTNVQSVLEELDTEKLNTTGGTLTGNLALNQSSSIIFEGATPNDFESTLTVIDPTADRTLSLPNVTGTLVSSGDTGTVTSTMILDGTILNTDINASAAIALTKLANVTAAHIIVGNASNVPTAVAITGDISISNAGLVAITADSIINADIKSDAAISGSKIVAGTTSVVGVVQLEDSAASSSTTKAATPAAVKVAKDAADAAATTANAALPTTGGTLTNNLIIDNAKQIRFAEADSNGANFVSLQAPDTLAADVSYTLPSAAPTASGQVLASTTGGVLSWTDDPTGQWVTNGTNVYYDGGNVGIGVGNSPRTELDLGTGQLSFSHRTDYSIRFYNGEGNNWSAINNPRTADGTNGSELEFRTATGVAMHMATDGKIGISTTSPVGNLETRDATRTNIIIAKTGLTVKQNSDLHTSYDTVQLGAGGALISYNAAVTTADTQLGHNFYRHSGGTWKRRYEDSAMRFRMNSPANTFIWERAVSGAADLDISWLNSMTLDGSGNVGIGGITSPVDKLNVAGAVRINQSTTLDHLCNAGTVLEVRGDGIGAGVVDTDFFKGFKIALNDGPEYGGQAQFAVGRWEENGTNARSSLMISLGHGGISSSSNADADVLLLNSNKHAEFFGGLTVDGTTLFVDAANSRCGIGTTSPGRIFDVTGSSNLGIARVVNTASSISNAAYTFMVDSSAHSSNMSLAGAMAVDVYSGRAFTIDGIGKCGIGTTAPKRHFHIHESANATVGMMLTNADTGASNDNQGFQFKVATDKHAEISQQEDSYIQILTNGGNAMRITNEQKVGIGTTSPSDPLHVRSTSEKVATFESTKTTDEGVEIAFYKNSSSPADGDQLGYLQFTGNDSADNPTIYNAIIGYSKTVNATAEDGEIRFYTRKSSTFTQTLTIHGDNGNLQINDGDLKVANGHGIDFSATGGPTGTGASGGSGLLDDYEIGTWVPLLMAASGTNITVDTNSSSGNYTKIGNVVTVTCYHRTDGITKGSASDSSYINIGNLPYTPSSNTQRNLSNIGFNVNWADYPNQALIKESSTMIELYKYASSGGNNTGTRLTVAAVATGSNANYALLTMVYRTA